jgi:hypothetical protein
MILHEILRGMDPYLSCGVPGVYWDLAIRLTQEIYGDSGVKLLQSAHRMYDDGIDYKTKITLHSLELWEDNGNTQLLPEDLIERLELECMQRFTFNKMSKEENEAT